MKLKEQKQLEQIGDQFDATDFSINEADIGRMLDAFSNGIYSNKIGSVIREIVSNAIDANVEAGRPDAPVRVGMVDEGKELFLHIIDQGLGMTPDFVKSIYTKYWASTKRESNKYIGAFGIGSKSPLSYTDSFECITRVEGVSYHYLVHKGDKVPKLELLLTSETDEPDGTTIRIPVKPLDRTRFQEEASKQLAYVDSIYFTGMAVSNDFKIYKEKKFVIRTNTPFKEMHIVINRVCYPISFDQLGIGPIKVPVGLVFDIGELSVTINRENVEYTEANKNKIKERIKEFCVDISKRYSDQFPTIETLEEYDKQTRRLRYQADIYTLKNDVLSISMDIKELRRHAGLPDFPLKVNIGPVWKGYYTSYGSDANLVRPFMKTIRTIDDNGKVSTRHAGDDRSVESLYSSPELYLFFNPEVDKWDKTKNLYIMDQMPNVHMIWVDQDLYKSIENETNEDKAERLREELDNTVQLFFSETSIINYSDLKVPADWLTNRAQMLKERLMQRADYLKMTGQIKFKAAGWDDNTSIIEHTSDPLTTVWHNVEVRSPRFHFREELIRDVVSNPYTVVYATNEHKEELYDMAYILSSKRSLNRWWSFALVSQANVKYFQANPNAIHILELMDGKHKQLRKIITAVWLRQKGKILRPNSDAPSAIINAYWELERFIEQNTFGMFSRLKDALLEAAEEGDLLLPDVMEDYERYVQTMVALPLLFTSATTDDQRESGLFDDIRYDLDFYTIHKKLKLQKDGQNTLQLLV